LSASRRRACIVTDCAGPFSLSDGDGPSHDELMPATDNFEGGARSSRRDEDASDSPEINEAERERAVRALRESYAGGGLTSKELEEQLTAIFTARSNAELADLIARESSRPAVARLPSRGV